ncbi:MAG: hypothetical protein HOO96_28660 [Polyangiaceae bacterium]|nr:hypothetical protein [Polyangiaceae bacterium]
MDYRDEGAAIEMRIAQLEEAIAPLRAARGAESDAAADRARRAAALRAAEARETELLREITELSVALKGDQELLRKAHAEAAARTTPDGFNRFHFFALCAGLAPLFGLAMFAADTERAAVVLVPAAVVIIGAIGASGWRGEGL